MRSQAGVDELLAVLPQLGELEVLRALIPTAGRPDPALEWTRAGSYATVDRRVVNPSALERALGDAEAAMHARVAALFGSLREVLDAFWVGDDVGLARALIAWGEAEEGSGRLADARRCFHAALGVSLPLPDRGPQVLALRRIARIERSLGCLAEAWSYYERSLEIAGEAGAALDAVIAETGLGNVHAAQGRFLEAEARYRSALRRAEQGPLDDGLALARAQLFNNLGTALTRLGREAEAEEWFARAGEAWSRIHSPPDLAVYHANRGILLRRQGRTGEAVAELVRALELPVASAVRASIAMELAECCLLQDRPAQAEGWVREAEEYAISSRSMYAMGHLYLGLGKLARARGDEDGFRFYEKALEIAREHEYQALEAETLLDYALLRRQLDGAAEAVAYLRRAEEIFRALGNVPEADRTLGERTRTAALPVVDPP